jgi:multidrug efflux pump subunit AcrA (membrane-fusion protein)
MPFLYELTLAAGEPAYTVSQQLVPVGTLVGTRQAVAVLSDGTMDFHLPVPTQGLLVEWFVTSGDTIQAGSVLARLVCEGNAVAVDDAVPVRLG